MRTPVLQKSNDDFSYQVYTEADRRFWFRLVRDGDRDLITDFFLGSFPPDDSGALLAACYRTLELTPGPIVVFRDIVSSREPGPDLVERAREFYTRAGSGLLNEFGRPSVQIQIEELRNKINLVLTAERES